MEIMEIEKLSAIGDLEEISNSEAKFDEVTVTDLINDVIDSSSDKNILEDQFLKLEDSSVSEKKNNLKNSDISIIFESESSLDVEKNNPGEGKLCVAAPRNASALSSIAIEYDSSDSEIETATEQTQAENTNVSDQEIPTALHNYRSNIEITCSSDEVDCEDDSSSSDDSGDSERVKSTESSSDEECQKDDERNMKHKTKNTSQRFKKEEKGEFDDLPPIEELHISVPEVLCDPLGEVAWIVDQMVVVRPKPEKPTLNIDTVLFVERGRRVLGRIFDVFGQVTDPHYCVRFNSSKHVDESDIRVGMNVYFCPNTEYTSVVFLHELTKMKACDPIGDDEPPEFSDDEEEQAYYQNLRKQQKNDKVDSRSNASNKRKRMMGPKPTGKSSADSRSGWQSHHPWNTKWKSQNQYYGNRSNQQNFNDSQVPCNSRSDWYPLGSYQQNLWPRFPAFQNPTWPMFYPPQTYGNSNIFRSPIEFRPPFQAPRFLNSSNWDVRQPHQSTQSETPPLENLLPLRLPPPPPPSHPPPPPSPGM